MKFSDVSAFVDAVRKHAHNKHARYVALSDESAAKIAACWTDGGWLFFDDLSCAPVRTAAEALATADLLLESCNDKEEKRSMERVVEIRRRRLADAIVDALGVPADDPVGSGEEAAQ